ncbi:universal stress protein [Halobellus clavatus]|jgi:nucleotide-binding universal stress UspA family protein|uniref:Nucleotide-binding universal stress protein, UspA family n=1 Tax=Halobellus clavatus TaxID=660517 RepID=A0A1H3FQG4_9EURY|nr:universal stress protein [Halobellus clavatus]SDX93246.1 Nucleotide-binding universal stress protein, UspA family [Halobellus clavatus]
MYDQILIPYDGSDEARKGAEHGVELAAAIGASVTALYVIDLPGAPRALALRDDEEEMREQYREYGEDVLDEICDVASELDVDCSTAFRTGSPAEEITDYADEEDMDAIVMGSAYRGTIGTILGGTADRVVRTSRVPVITQRMKMEDI